MLERASGALLQQDHLPRELQHVAHVREVSDADARETSAATRRSALAHPETTTITATTAAATTTPSQQSAPPASWSALLAAHTGVLASLVAHRP